MSLLALFLVLLVATMFYVTVWFAIARLTNRTDVVDIAWGLGFVYVIVVAWLIQDRPLGIPLWIVLFVTAWGVRLALHIGLRNSRKTEDHRYVAYRHKWKAAYWPNAYLRIFLVQSVLLLVICSSAIAGIVADSSANIVLVLIGFAVWAGGILCEAIADYQLGRFVRHKKPGQIMQAGLWRYSRHPNYFGELAAWWGCAVVGMGLGQWWSFIGAALITLLITKVSGIPLLEQHYADNPEFQQYKKHTSVLLPLPRR